jgi:hypothetical protein
LQNFKYTGFVFHKKFTLFNFYYLLGEWMTGWIIG